MVRRGAGGPVDRRLLRQAGAARGYLAVAAGLGLAGAALILLQADLLSRALAGAARGTGASALAPVPRAAPARARDSRSACSRISAAPARPSPAATARYPRAAPACRSNRRSTGPPAPLLTTLASVSRC